MLVTTISSGSPWHGSDPTLTASAPTDPGCPEFTGLTALQIAREQWRLSGAQKKRNREVIAVLREAASSAFWDEANSSRAEKPKPFDHNVMITFINSSYED